jgi:hypothetical protein
MAKFRFFMLQSKLKRVAFLTLIGGVVLSYQNCAPSSYEFQASNAKLNSAPAVVSTGTPDRSGPAGSSGGIDPVGGSADTTPSPTATPDEVATTYRSAEVDPTFMSEKPLMKVVMVVDNSFSMSQAQTYLAKGIGDMVNGIHIPNKDGSIGMNVDFYIVSTNGLKDSKGNTRLKNDTVYSILQAGTYTPLMSTLPNLDNPYTRTTNYLPYYNETSPYQIISFRSGMSDSDFNTGVAAFKSAITSIGTSGSDTEEGICVLNRTLFLEDQARKIFNVGDKAAFVVLSDENDQSTSATCVASTQQQCAGSTTKAVPQSVTCSGADCDSITYSLNMSTQDPTAIGKRFIRYGYQQNVNGTSTNGDRKYKLNLSVWKKYLLSDGVPIVGQFDNADKQSFSTYSSVIKSYTDDMACTSQPTCTSAQLSEATSALGITDALKVSCSVACEKQAVATVTLTAKSADIQLGAASSWTCAPTTCDGPQSTQALSALAGLKSTLPSILSSTPTSCQVMCAAPPFSSAVRRTLIDVDNKSKNLCTSGFALVSAPGVSYLNLQDYFKKTFAPAMNVNFSTCNVVKQKSVTVNITTPGACSNPTAGLIVDKAFPPAPFPTATPVPAADDRLFKAFVNKSQQLFGPTGYVVSAIVEDSAANSSLGCALQPGQSFGVRYEALMAMTPFGGSLTSICAPSFMPSMNLLSKFITDVIGRSYRVPLGAGEVIDSVSLDRSGSVIGLKIGADVDVRADSLEFVDGVLHDGDKIEVSVKKTVTIHH